MDPFIIVYQATQIYYLKYPSRFRDKFEWTIIMKIKSHTREKIQNTIELAHHEVEIISFELLMHEVEPLLC